MPKKVRKPIIGEKIYVPTSLYLSHGRDDFAGGIATIDYIKEDTKSDILDYNRIMVGIKERENTGYNWQYLLANQEKWSKEYAGCIAHPDPDYAEEANRDD